MRIHNNLPNLNLDRICIRLKLLKLSLDRILTLHLLHLHVVLRRKHTSHLLGHRLRLWALFGRMNMVSEITIPLTLLHPQSLPALGRSLQTMLHQPGPSITE